MTIPDPNPYPAQTEREYMICANSFQAGWFGNNRAALARKWGITQQELIKILRGPYGPGSWNG